MPILAIALGGALGSVLRYLVGTLAPPRPGAIPWSTLAINVTGSLLLGFFARYLAPSEVEGARGSALYAGLTVGVCGGFTTFSTFGLELLRLVERGSGSRALVYAASSVGLALVGTALGATLGRALRAS